MGSKAVYPLKFQQTFYNEIKLLTIISTNLPNKPNNKPDQPNTKPLMIYIALIKLPPHFIEIISIIAMSKIIDLIDRSINLAFNARISSCSPTLVFEYWA